LRQGRGAVGRILSYSHERARERLAQRRGIVAGLYNGLWFVEERDAAKV